jgi:hypothetical protein
MPGPTGAGWYQTGQPSSQGTVNEAGTFEPSGAPIPVGSPLNPFIDASPWGQVRISGILIPGVIQDVDGADKPEEWQVQKGTKESNASTDWKGTKLAESIKITTKLHNAESFAAYYVIRDTLRPKITERPPVHVVENPSINFNNIVRVSIKNISPPKWQAGGGYWLGSVELIEFNPSKPANTGKPKGKGKDPNADVKNELDAVVKEAGAL